MPIFDRSEEDAWLGEDLQRNPDDPAAVKRNMRESKEKASRMIVDPLQLELLFPNVG